MPVSKSRFLHLAVVYPAVVFSMLLPQPMWAQYSESVLYNFCPLAHCSDGDNPGYATLVFDSQGNLYGTTLFGGPANGNGVVYKLTSPPGGSGPWTETVLYTFCSLSNCSDGAAPYSGVIFDSSGNLYGTTQQGGSSHNAGVVYQLTPPPGGSGPWTETVIHTFCLQTGCPDGSGPLAGLTMDSRGNLYGTALAGGTGAGVIFELSPSVGSWNFSTLYNFCSLQGCADGEEPYTGSLIFDSADNLYGTTEYGGAKGAGTVYELSPSGGGWMEKVLYSFCPVSLCHDGESPDGTMVFDPQGNLYGTATAGGLNGEGTLFELSPAGSGSWTQSVLLNFSPSGGIIPEAGLNIDAHGNLYGTTLQGGGANSGGVVYELSPTGGGQWTENVLWTFCTGSCLDGAAPEAGVIFDSHGNLYGSTTRSGSENAGVVYEVSPTPLIPTSTVLTSAPNPSNLGQEVTMTATVTAQNGAIPTGTVIFESNGVAIGSGTLNNSGLAVLDYSGLSGGTDSLVAIYQGSRTLAGSTSNTVPQVVNRIASTTTVTSSQNPSLSGDPVTLTATVGPAGPPTPTGTVSFTSNGTAIGGCSALTLSSQLTAACTTSSLAVGTDAIVATYSGDNNYSSSNGTFSQLVNPLPVAWQFVPITPCRVVDTRHANGLFGGPAIAGGTARSFALPSGACDIPSAATAYSLNVTVVPLGSLGYLTIWTEGEGQPVVCTMNSLDGRIKANAAIVPAGTDGAVSVYVSNTTNVVIDIDGYFTTPGADTLQFYALTPCRVLDTRKSNGPLGGPYLHGAHERDFPVLSSDCGIPASAVAYSMNFTVVPYNGNLWAT